MPHEERYNTRDRSYSAWHRRRSTGRYIGVELAQTLGMIDLDASLYVEYDDGTKEPLALIETAMDCGQGFKPSTVTRNLARRCVPVVPAFVLLYRLSNAKNPADERFQDIQSFRVRRIYPKPHTDWVECTPERWAQYLVSLRKKSAGLVDEMNGWMEAAE